MVNSIELGEADIIAFPFSSEGIIFKISDSTHRAYFFNSQYLRVMDFFAVGPMH